MINLITNKSHLEFSYASSQSSAGWVLCLFDSHFYKVNETLETSSNIYAKLMALRLLFIFPSKIM